MARVTDFDGFAIHLLVRHGMGSGVSEPIKISDARY